MRQIFVVLALAFLVMSCGSKNKNSAAEADREIKLPTIPAIIVEPQERSEYMAAHFWDRFDFTDTAYISLPDVTEQAFVDYLTFLTYSSPEAGTEAINKMLTKALPTPEMFDYFTGLYEKYLYEEGSPVRNEELYIPVLEYIVNSDKVDELKKLRPRSQLNLVLQNRVGQQANDFQFTTPDGRVTKLSQNRSFFTLLFIYNPGCSSCRQVTQEILNSPALSTAIRLQIVKVVAIYPDKDTALWREHLSELPQNWVHGYDHGRVLDVGLYDLKAIPSLYLLDSDMEVIIKDAPSAAPIEAYFRQVEQ